jgi:hypothetical protein
MICHICKLPIHKGQDIAVYSVPVKSLDSNGNYNPFGDFCSNETKVHAKCFKLENVKYQAPTATNKVVSNDMAKQLREALREVGEDVDASEAIEFVAENLDITDLSELIGEWFRNRNGVV